MPRSNRERQPAGLAFILLVTILFLIFPVTPAHASSASIPFVVMNPERFAKLTSRQINDELFRLEAAYPDLISHTVIGRSANGRDILRMRLASSVVLSTSDPIPDPLPSVPATPDPPPVPSATSSAIGLSADLPFNPTTAAITTQAAFEQGWHQRGKPLILVEAGIHARETANPYIAYRILANYAKDAVTEGHLPQLGMSALLSECSFDFVILSNPDGYDLVKHGKTPLTVPGILTFLNSINPSRFPVFKANASGVDLNRNFPAIYYDGKSGRWIDLWGKRQNGATLSRGLYSSVPSAMFYSGAKPASEPETKALASLVKKEDYRILLSFHSMGNVIYWNRPYLSASYNADSKPYALKAGGITRYKLLSTTLSDNYSGYFGDFVANETQKPCLTVETTNSSLPTPWQACMEAYNRVATLPYAMAEMALANGYARYRLFDRNGTYVRDMKDSVYAKALAERDGLSVWDSGLSALSAK